MPISIKILISVTAILSFGVATSGAQQRHETFEQRIRPLINRYCADCHGGEKVKGKVDFSEIQSDEDVDTRLELLETMVDVLDSKEMPPKDKPQPTETERQTILAWLRDRTAAPVESVPSTFMPRRLSGPEYRNTLRSLFGFDLEVNIVEAEQTVSERSLVLKLLPTDPPGASGFVNDTHGARLSTVLWDQYSYLSETAVNQLFTRKRRAHLSALLAEDLPKDFKPGQLTSDQAQKLLREFVPRAWRRPVAGKRMSPILESLEGLNGITLVKVVKTELKAVLMSPAFLYRGLLMESNPGRQPVDDFELAERLSYFLTEDRPDAELTDVANRGTLTDPAVFAVQIDRLLCSSSGRTLSESFGAQWLTLGQIAEAANDPTQEHALKSQPIDFLNYLFTEDRPVMELIDSQTAFANNVTAPYYGKDRQQMERYIKPKGIEKQARPNQRLNLRHAEGRGGILTMPGILAMNKGPILRGTWMLRRILGENLGEPPANIPPIKSSPPGQKLTFRERFEKHRSDPSCSRCHEKIDPLGFALQAYDERGGFMLASDYRPAKKRKQARDGQRSNKIDTTGQLPSGETFEDFDGLKTILLTSKRRDIIRNAVERMLSYALCRKLKVSDRPTVNAITAKIHENDGTWRNLVHEITNSVPFRETIIPEKEPQ